MRARPGMASGLLPTPPQSRAAFTRRGQAGGKALGAGCASEAFKRLHLLPAVRGEQQMHRMVLQLPFLLQVRAQQPADIS